MEGCSRNGDNEQVIPPFQLECFAPMSNRKQTSALCFIHMAFGPTLLIGFSKDQKVEAMQKDR